MSYLFMATFAFLFWQAIERVSVARPPNHEMTNGVTQKVTAILSSESSSQNI